MPLSILFPRKCVLCRHILKHRETDLCHDCRRAAPVILNTKRKLPNIAHWTSVWYYKEDVRKSIHRFKFYNARSYADVYARLIAASVLASEFGDKIDCITWVPTSWIRKLKRGYDQAELLAKALQKELGVSAIPLLKRIRHTPAQSTIHDAAMRRANILNAYSINPRHSPAGKRILLLDDVLTTGATASECAKTLLAAGAAEIFFSSIAVVGKD